MWTWRPSWPCLQDHLNKFSFPYSIEAPHKIWLWLAQWFLRRYLKSVDHGRRRQRTTTADDRGLPILKSSSVSLRIRWAHNTKTNRNGRANIDNYNKPQQKQCTGTVSNKLLEGLNNFYSRATFALGSAVVHKHTYCLVRMKEFYSSRHHNSKQDLTLTWNQMSTERLSNKNPTVEFGGPDQWQSIEPQPTLLKVFRLEPLFCLRPDSPECN